MRGLASVALIRPSVKTLGNFHTTPAFTSKSLFGLPKSSLQPGGLLVFTFFILGGLRDFTLIILGGVGLVMFFGVCSKNQRGDWGRLPLQILRSSRSSEQLLLIVVRRYIQRLVAIQSFSVIIAVYLDRPPCSSRKHVSYTVSCKDHLHCTLPYNEGTMNDCRFSILGHASAIFFLDRARAIGKW